MSEVRTTSATGGEKGVKPQRYSLLPKLGLDAIAEVFAFGATKYADHNWRRGYEWDKSFDALFRHAFAAQNGETYDEESGLPHLAHAGFHVLVLLTWLAEQGEGPDNLFDTRWPAGMERAREEAAAEEQILSDDLWEAAVRPDSYWSVTDLKPIQDQINEQVRKLAGWTELGYVDSAPPFSVEWRDSEPLTFAGLQEALAEYTRAMIPARFTCGEHGIEDADHPLTDEQNEAAEQGMIRIASDGVREIWAKPEALERPTPTYAISVVQYDEEHHPVDDAARFYLNHWVNRPGI